MGKTDEQLRQGMKDAVTQMHREDRENPTAWAEFLKSVMEK